MYTCTVFAEIFIIVLISDVTFITKFKKLNHWRCTAQHAGLASSLKLKQHENLKNGLLSNENFTKYGMSHNHYFHMDNN